VSLGAIKDFMRVSSNLSNYPHDFGIRIIGPSRRQHVIDILLHLQKGRTSSISIFPIYSTSCGVDWYLPCSAIEEERSSEVRHRRVSSMFAVSFDDPFRGVALRGRARRSNHNKARVATRGIVPEEYSGYRDRSRLSIRRLRTDPDVDTVTCLHLAAGDCPGIRVPLPYSFDNSKAWRAHFSRMAGFIRLSKLGEVNHVM
jgi:hypothetical protein